MTELWPLAHQSDNLEFMVWNKLPNRSISIVFRYGDTIKYKAEKYSYIFPLLRLYAELFVNNAGI